MLLPQNKTFRLKTATEESDWKRLCRVRTQNICASLNKKRFKLILPRRWILVTFIINLVKVHLDFYSSLSSTAVWEICFKTWLCVQGAEDVLLTAFSKGFAMDAPTCLYRLFPLWSSVIHSVFWSTYLHSDQSIAIGIRWNPTTHFCYGHNYISQGIIEIIASYIMLI